MCYRPTVRYDAAYRTYINSLFRATNLDRNQLIRLALFTSGHSDDYYAILRQHQRKDVPTLPSPKWKPDQHGYWMEQVFAVEEEVDTDGDVSKRQRDEKGRFTIQPNQSESLTKEALDSRWNKVVIKKIPDTHASYRIKQRLFTEIESEIALIISATLVLSIFI